MNYQEQVAYYKEELMTDAERERRRNLRRRATEHRREKVRRTARWLAALVGLALILIEAVHPLGFVVLIISIALPVPLLANWSARVLE